MAVASLMKSFFNELRRRHVVRVAGMYAVIAWGVAQAADVLQGALNLPPWFDSMVISLLALGFPIAMILAWAFDLTPEGIKRTSSEDAGEAPVAGHKLDVAIVIGLLVIGGFIISDVFKSPAGENDAEAPVAEVATSADSNKVVAVLPFSNRSANEDDVFFVDGVHDDLLTRLSNLSDLQVISRTSVMQYRDTQKSIPEIARELGVAVVLEGAVQRAGDRIRINVQLIDGVTDAHLWAEIYDRELTTENLFDIQAEISQTIAASLNAALTGEEQNDLGQALTDNLEAYNAFLRGVALGDRALHTPSRLRGAIAAYDEAIALDDQFVAAYAAKAEALLRQYWFFGAGRTVIEQADAALVKAEAIAPNSIAALLVRGYYLYWAELDFVRAEDYADRALALAPNSGRILILKGSIARRDGRFRESTGYWERALAVDPLDQFITLDLASTYLYIGDYGAAEQLIERAMSLGDRNGFLAWIRSSYFLQISDQENAWAAISEVPPEAIPVTYFRRAEVAYLLGNAEGMKLSLDIWPAAQHEPDGYPEAYALAEIRYFHLIGDLDAKGAALEALRARLTSRGANEQERWASNMVYSPLTIPVLLGDVGAVDEAIASYDDLPRDEWLRRAFNESSAAALAELGDFDAAADHIEQNMTALSPLNFKPMTDWRFYDPFREHPRYLELQSRYEAAVRDMNEQ